MDTPMDIIATTWFSYYFFVLFFIIHASGRLDLRVLTNLSTYTADR